tara:strand:- start:904 stop:1551 length:648 start_codon:yes stop_codon:yes gene_type:complete
MVEFDPIESKDVVDPHWSDYINAFRENKIFRHVKDKSVLELAANGGWHSRCIYENNPSKLVCVEPNEFFKEPLEDNFTSHYDNAECFWGTYNSYLEHKKEEFDVVVCCGLLYHLHSPIDCIEKILNIHRPDILILESYDIPFEHLNEEELDISGNAFSDKEIYIPYNFFIPMNKYKNILSSVNYECLEHYIWKDYNINHTSKHDAQLMIFKNNNG